ncbi:hypothetical protein NKW84_16910 [Acetobacter senegalensis]|uniref:hypothetical protein n=1 Tax=Acetobacter senegalensis TaxID=446692 RepID=UPI0020A135B5|nr:hypothetical protein [Acetobacter senegalensis]MCP1197515.1 hypothetical protein [Acetobacter senegalensis]
MTFDPGHTNRLASRVWDISRDLPSGRILRVPNAGGTIAEWAETLTSEKLFVFEATSGCNNIVFTAQIELAHPFSRLNLREARVLVQRWAQPCAIPVTVRGENRKQQQAGKSNDPADGQQRQGCGQIANRTPDDKISGPEQRWQSK